MINKEERFDIVIVGGGHNGITAAAYLSKCGLSVCVLEERPEVGGGQENTEPRAGVRIDPHATYLYGGAAPGFEQLELWKYGFRMSWSPALQPVEDEMRGGGSLTTDGVVPITMKDMLGFAKLTGIATGQPFLKELLRAVYWCPPHPQDMEQTPDDIPWVQVIKQRAPDVWTDELLEWSLFDLMDEWMETEPYKVMQAAVAWYSGAAPHWKGVAIQAFAGAASLMIGGTSPPRGGMHHYAHSIARCAIAHGARLLTCCPVEEIIVENGRAKGVRLRDNAAWGEKIIWADKAVLSAVDVKQTFLRLIGPRHIDVSFMQRVKDISLKGGSLFVSHILLREPPVFAPKFASARPDQPIVNRIVYPCDSREILMEQITDVDSRKVTPNLHPDKLLFIDVGAKTYDPSSCTIPGHYLVSPLYLEVPAPEYHVDGPEAVNKQKPEIDAAMIRAYSQVAANVNSDTVVDYWSNTPHDSELRNVGLLGGNWYATRHCADQWEGQRPLPELARYRTPIEGLYLCNQTSHPGGLCLMAVPYNLMHILIEDGIAEPGDWWYPSPWYIPEKKKEAVYR